MVKISPYHNVNDKCKEIIIKDFIEHLTNDEYFMNPVNKAKFPIFDGESIIGNSNVYSVIEDSLKQYIKNLK